MEYLMADPMFYVPVLFLIIGLPVWLITFFVSGKVIGNKNKNMANTLRENIKKIGNPVGQSYAQIKSILGEPDVNETVMEKDGKPGTIKRWGRFSDLQFCLAFNEQDICTRVEKCNIAL